MHDLDAKRLLFCTEGRDHSTIQAFAQDLQAYGGEPTAIDQQLGKASLASPP